MSADSRLLECVDSLRAQSFRDFEIVLIDNSGAGRVRRLGLGDVRVFEQPGNTGFGAAINAGIRQSDAAYIATLNDDAVAHPRWLAALVEAMECHPEAGMCASQVRLFGEQHLDSAGMLIARDGSSKQRGHLWPVDNFPEFEEVLLPSGSAAIYRRAMLDQVGVFDEDFFLYCEDTDLGLRSRWSGWRCYYIPEAVVEHHYSHSAGRASPLKAYYVERNRMFVLVKNFPSGLLWTAPFASAARYAWHVWFLLQGRGTAARFRREGNAGIRMLWFVVRAHLAVLRHSAVLLRKRREVAARAKIAPGEFRALLRKHAISLRKVAEL